MNTTNTTEAVGVGVRRFLMRAACMAALVVTGYLTVLVAPIEKGSYLSAVIDKQARLKSLPSPKLVFVGGSNLSFAVDSARVEREIGLPVANMGLGIYAGLRFMLESVVPRLGSGDVVVVSAEYQLFRGLYNGQEELLEVLDAFPEGLSTVSRKQAVGLVRAMPTYIKNKANRMAAPLFQSPDPACVYCRRAFNEYGDIVASLTASKKDVAPMPMFRSKAEQGPVDREAVKGLADFVRGAAERGARVVIMFPAVPRPQFEKNRAVLEEVAAKIRADVPAPILGEPADNVMPVELFYDWVYHLLPEGREQRTGVLISRLKTFLASSSLPAATPPREP